MEPVYLILTLVFCVIAALAILFDKDDKNEPVSPPEPAPAPAPQQPVAPTEWEPPPPRRVRVIQALPEQSPGRSSRA